jgi:hypothetical protein
VGREHIGRAAQCPQCQTEYCVPIENGPTIKVGGPPTNRPPENMDAADWRLRSSQGLIYGPVTRLILDDWCAQGRISPDAQIMSPENDRWRWATAMFPTLWQTPSLAAEVGESPFAKSAPPIRPLRRGLLLLLLSVVGFFTWGAPAVFAILVASYDLAFQRKKLNDQHRWLTLASLVVGVLALMVWTAFVAGLMIYWFSREFESQLPG